MLKKQIGPLVDPHILEDFKKLCRKESLSLGRAVQRLMEAALELNSIYDVESVIDSYKPRLQKKYRLELEREMIILDEEFKEDREKKSQNEAVYFKYEKMRRGEKIITLLPPVNDPRLIKRASKLVLEISKFYTTA